MFDHRADVLQFGAKTQAFEIALVGLGKRAREMGVRFEGGEVFDAEHGFGMDGDGLNGGSLGSGKANRGTESAQGEEFAFFGGEFPVAGELDEAGVVGQLTPSISVSTSMRRRSSGVDSAVCVTA